MDRNALAELLQALESRRDAEERRREERYTALIERGPNRDPAEVLQQRYKPLEPTLRVASSITSVEEAREELKRKEWGSQVNDKLQVPVFEMHSNTFY
ncbi:UNVERIFIED_CONTAM: hypothetical protein FKN15_055535 [Acipenser sinensis]